MKRADVYFFLAQGGEITSAGIEQLAEDVRSWPNVRVQTYHWDQWQLAVKDINDHAKEDCVRLTCGYSLGANALTWVLGGAADKGIFVPGINGVSFDAGVFIDPTWLSVMTPLYSTTLNKALHFHNVSLDLIGHADMVLSADFKNIKVVQTYGSHFTVDLDKDVQRQTLDFLVGARI